MEHERSLRPWWLALVLAASFALLTGCAKQSNEIVIGEYGSLTGTTATFGISSKNGIELFMDNLNAAGGIGGTKVKVIVEDDQSKPEEAATAVNKLVDQDGVLAVLGEWLRAQHGGRSDLPAGGRADDLALVRQSG
jgi:branched-chain amino acid transport system substrate-binding protein